MSDPKNSPKKTDPEDDLLEFLGGIDEINDESADDDFSDFLAKADIERLKEAARKPRAPAKDGE